MKGKLTKAVLEEVARVAVGAGVFGSHLMLHRDIAGLHERIAKTGRECRHPDRGIRSTAGGAVRSSLVLAFALTLTLHGQPFTPTVNVYRFQPPVVEPEQVSQTSTPQPVSRRRRVLTYAAVGALGACLYGSIEARHFGEPDESGRICKAYAALGAAAGVTLGAMWPER